MEIFPLSLVLAGRIVPVVGAGSLADAKVDAVRRAGGVPLLLTPDQPLPALAERGPIALVADDQPERARLWAMQLRNAGYLVNVADQPDQCDFLLPAVIDRRPVYVAIATGGASATLARRLREQLESVLPAHLGALATAIAEARPAVARQLSTSALRRQFWDDALRAGGPLDPFGDAPSVLPDDIARLGLAAERLPVLAVILLSGPNPDDMTLRALRRLHSADAVLAVGTWAVAVADRARRDARRVMLDSLPPDWADRVTASDPLTVLLVPEGTACVPPAGFRIETLQCGKAEL